MKTKIKKIEAIAIAAIMIVSIFGAIAPMTSADEASEVGETYPSQDTPGVLEVFLVNGSTVNGSTGYINASYWINTTAWSVNASYEGGRTENTTITEGTTVKAIEFAINNASYQNKTIIIGQGIYNATATGGGSTLTLDQDAMWVKSHSTADTVIINASTFTGGTSSSPTAIFKIAADNATVGGAGTGLAMNGSIADFTAGVYTRCTAFLSNITIQDNNITNTNIGVFLHQDDLISLTELTVKNNTISAPAGSKYSWGDGCTESGISFMVGYGATDDMVLMNSTITGNTITDYTECIVLHAVNNTVISDNVLTSNIGYTGISVDVRKGTNTTNVTIDGNTITNISRGTWATGIAIDKSAATPGGVNITNITITNNTVADCTINIGLRRQTNDYPIEAPDMRTITVMYNNLSGGVLYGLYNGHNRSDEPGTTGAPLDARYNYWGSEYGPGGNGSGIGGDILSTNVTYWKWLKSDDNTNVTTLLEKSLIAYPVEGVTVDEYPKINVTIANTSAYDLWPYSSATTPTLKMVKVAGPGTIDASLTTAGNGTADNPVIFTVMATADGEYTLKVYETSVPLTAMSFTQTFEGTPTGATVTADNSTLIADTADTVNITLQLDSPTSGAQVTWTITNGAAAGVSEDYKETTTNVTGAAQLRITASNSGYDLTIEGKANLAGTEYIDSCTVSTIAGNVSNSTSALYVNYTTADIPTGITVGDMIQVAVRVNDSQNNLVEGETITLTANQTGATFANSAPVSLATGWANTTITLPTEVNTTMIRAITGAGNASYYGELNQTLNVTTTAANATKIAVYPGKSIGLENVKGKDKDITIQLQDTYANNNTAAEATVLIATDNEVLGNMTYSGTTVNNNLWCNISTGGSNSFTYTINSTIEGMATLTVTVNVTGGDLFTDTIVITTSGPTGINLTVNPTLPLVGQDAVTATAQLKGTVGDIAIADIDITFTLRDPNNMLINVSTDDTDTTGAATFTFTETTRGTYTIKAKNTTYDISATNWTTYVGNATRLWIVVNETSPAVNEMISIDAIFKDDVGLNSSSVDTTNLDVSFLVDDSLVATSDISSGVASATYNQSAVGTVIIDVIFTNTSSVYWNGTTATSTNSTNVTFGAVVPTCPWDLSGLAGVPDGTVNIFDIVAVADQWAETGAAGWIAEDLSGIAGTPDGTINIYDIVAVADHWGACPT